MATKTLERVKFQLVRSDGIGIHAEAMADLYDRYFVPPELKSDHPEFYSRTRFLDRVIENYANKPSFSSVLAFAEDRLVGFVTAAALPPDANWWKVVTPVPPEHECHETGSRTVAIFDLLVVPEWRQIGIASQLHQQLLADRTEERITLLSSRPQQPAYDMWLHWGYDVIGTARPAENGPELDLFVKPMKQQTRPV